MTKRFRIGLLLYAIPIVILLVFVGIKWAWWVPVVAVVFTAMVVAGALLMVFGHDE